jgi:polyhydroxyalkanoate synthase
VKDFSAKPARPAEPDVDSFDRLLHAAEGKLTFGLSPAGLWLAWADWAVHLANSPHRRLMLARHWVDHCVRLSRAMGGQTDCCMPAPDDHRFSDPAWQDFPFNLVYHYFLMVEDWWAEATTKVRGVERPHERIVSFAARQWLDMFSPSNLPWLNPEVVQATAASGGKNLRIGLQNFMDDLRRVTQPQRDPDFVVGRDVAVTKGKVVLRNKLIELIQYSPAGKKVHPEPILIVPAWIMKYYILDLSPHDSLIAYLVAQGFTVFCISWRNPDGDLSQMSLDDYRKLGVMDALAAVTAITGAERVHGCGYCLGGTLFAIAAAAMARDGDQRLASLTLLAAQTDFTEAGELQLFITEGQLAFLEDVMWAQGTLASGQMAGAFQLMRSNDLIWSRMVRNYFLGRRDHPNDLAAWNRDATRMPYRMHAEYLRRLFLDNDLAEGRFPVDGRPVSIEDISAPIFTVGTVTDHVAPWRSVHKIHLLNEGEITFVLTSGGHNAGIVSEPGHPHRHYQIMARAHNGRFMGPDEWQALAERVEGSWWNAWVAWLKARSGAAAAPPRLGAPDKGYKPLCDAPGHYVLQP